MRRSPFRIRQFLAAQSAAAAVDGEANGVCHVMLQRKGRPERAAFRIMNSTYFAGARS